MISNSSTQITIHRFLKKIHQTIKEFKMVNDGEFVLVGVSGGPDSMALLYALIDISKTLGFTIGIAHLNHGIRDYDSDADAGYVLSVAKNLGIACYIEKIDIRRECKRKRISLEEAGREARYNFFNRVAEKKGFDKIAVGHQKDDNAELILLNLLRGSGTTGLSGIPPVRGKIIRPLIFSTRNEILTYLTHHHLGYRIDSSNTDTRFKRNKIRHHLIPLLKTVYNPNLSESLARLGILLRAEEDWMNQYIFSIVDQTTLKLSKNYISLSINKLKQLHVAIQRKVIRQAILHAKGDLRRIMYLHIDAAIRLLTGNCTNGQLDLPDRVRIYKQDNQLIVSKERNSLRSIELFREIADLINYEYIIHESDLFNKPLFINEIDATIRFNKLNRTDIAHVNTTAFYLALLDWDHILFPMVIRNYRTGDSFIPLGMEGTQTLKKFFINNKINKHKRIRVPIFLSGEKIAWVGGIRISDQFKVTPDTKTILTAELC
jgi:tRNA(Ile)-lysidine synthase